jgi:LacI family transcriptional regulator
MMRGEPPERQLWLLPPRGLSARRSTDTLSTDDPLVVTALRLIREHACEGIKVADVVRAVKRTRRVVEARFLKRMGHSLHEAIARAQFRRVEELLRDTKLSLAAIAARTGFKHPEYLTVAFTRRYGMPPSRWRMNGAGAGPGES